MFSTDSTLIGVNSKCGAATDKATVPIFISTPGTKSTPGQDDRSCLGFLAGVSSECKYAGCLDESA